MDILSVILGTVSSIVAYTLLMAGVYKLYTIGNDLTEIKKLLREQTQEQPVHALESVLRE